ncbi:MAG: phosphate acyltransferase [Thermoleophilaceae bacterium]|jgi:glycerol-3-phosphate acyltransferase PlsX|nr:phosphate acyltransferase [Thermoleophilaceae bacterium]
MTTTTTTKPVAVDTNGADGGPDLVTEGARLAGTPVTLFDGAEISGDEDPAFAVRSREDASIVRAAKAVGAGEADALVSAGATGALLAASLFHVKRIRGVHRPAIAVLVPLPGKPVLLLDAGANVDVRPEHLVQFAYMGAAFMEAVQGVERARVGLLSIGEEAKKGTDDVVAAHEQLAAGTLDFAGNVEGGDLAGAAVDVVVTDGFTGNVALKLMEGTAKTVAGAVRDAVRSGVVSSLGGLLIRSKLDGLRARLDPNTTGGAILLGVRRPVVVAHGKSSAEGIANAVRLARRAADEDMVERTAAALAEGRALRSAPTASFAASHD